MLGVARRVGDSVYGFVRVQGEFDSGGNYGPDGQYKHQLKVTQAEPIEQVRRVDHKIDDAPLGEGKVSFQELQQNPEAYNGPVPCYCPETCVLE